MASLREFSQRIKVIAATVEKGGPKVARQTAALILQTAVMATPVGNVTLWTAQARRRARPGYVGGRARANWTVSIGAPILSTTDETDASGGTTVARGNNVLSALPVKGDVEIHITNNLPYIVPLNQGHSHQAPAGFVELAVEAALDGIKRMTVLK